MIKTIFSKLMSKNRYGYEFYEDQTEMNGKSGTYNFVKRDPGFVAVCAFDGARIYLIRNYRYPIKKYLWELPKGYIGEKESPLAAAKRELKEETGVIAKKWKKIGDYQALSGFIDIKCHLYLATDLNKAKTQIEDDEDIRSCKKFRPDEVMSIDLCTNFVVSYLKRKSQADLMLI